MKIFRLVPEETTRPTKNQVTIKNEILFTIERKYFQMQIHCHSQIISKLTKFCQHKIRQIESLKL